jgi:hypothetical protein
MKNDALIEKDLAKIRALLLAADYKSAKQIAERLRKQVGTHFEVEYMYAKVLGDYADELPPAQQRKLKNASIRILEKLIYQLNGKSIETRYGIRINYYYQTKRFRDLERVGKTAPASHRIKGLYSAGAGASLEAERIVRAKGSLTRAQNVAHRAVGYWKHYFRLNPRETYYFPYTLLAMAEAILGNEREMESALKKAARLSKRKIDFWEFEDVRKLLV